MCHTVSDYAASLDKLDIKYPINTGEFSILKYVYACSLTLHKIMFMLLYNSNLKIVITD